MLHLPRKPTYPIWALPYFANGWPLVNGRSIGTIHHITSGVAKWSRAPSCSRRLFSSSSHTLRSSSVIKETPSRDHSQHACSRTCGKRSLKISVCLDDFLGKNGDFSTSVLVSWISCSSSTPDVFMVTCSLGQGSVSSDQTVPELHGICSNPQYAAILCRIWIWNWSSKHL